MDQFKVSVVVPTYNSMAYLEQGMHSLLKQTLAELEIIVVDDGSSDGTFEYISSLQSKYHNIKLIAKSNSGYGHSMNLGMALAKGAYVGIMESDDYVDSHMFEDLYNQAILHDLDFVKADFVKFYEANGKELNEYIEISKVNKTWYNTLLNSSEMPQLLDITMNTWSGIYKKSFLKKNSIVHNETPGASYQDNGFWFQTFYFAKRVMFINKPYYHLRRDNPNSSVKNKGKVYCICDEYDYILSKLSENKETYDLFIYMYQKKKYHNYMFTITRIADEFKLEFILRMSEEFKKSKNNNELKESVFSTNEWKVLNQIIDSPEEYYRTISKKKQGPSIISKLMGTSASEDCDYSKIACLYNSDDKQNHIDAFNQCKKIKTPQARVWLARMYANGIGTEANYSLACKNYEKVISKNESQTTPEYIDYLLKNKSCATSSNKAFQYAKRYSSSDQPAVCGRLARMYRDGVGTEKDLEKAKYWMTIASDNGLKWAHLELIDLLLNTGDSTNAFIVSTKFASSNQPAVCGRLARMYRDGVGTEKDLEKAKYWMTIASDNGLKWAEKELIAMDISITQKRLEWIKTGKELGFKVSLIEIIDSLYKSDSSADKKIAFELALASSSEAEPAICGRLARMYVEGKVTAKDYGSALKYMKIASDKGVGWAHAEYINVLLKTGTEDNMEMAFEVAKKFATQDHPGICGALGRMYRDGIGTEKNLDFAIKYLKESSEHGVSWAHKEYYKLLIERNTEDDLRIAEKLKKTYENSEKPWN